MLDVFLDDGVQIGTSRCGCKVERCDEFSEWGELAAKGSVRGWGPCGDGLSGLETCKCTATLRVPCDD